MTSYLAQCDFVDYRSFSEEVANLTQLFPLVDSAVGTFGMTGLDRLLGLEATGILQKIIGVMEATIFKDRSWIELLENLSNSLNPIENVIGQVFTERKRNLAVFEHDF